MNHMVAVITVWTEVAFESCSCNKSNLCKQYCALLIGYSDTSFQATFDVDYLTPTNPIVFNVARNNAGGHYDPTTGIYTVPLDGTYEFKFHFYTRID